MYILHMALSDITEKTHFFKQDTRLFRRGKVKVSYDEVIFAPYTHFVKKEKEFLLSVTNEEFDLHLTLNKGKGGVWHCDKGVLAMGLPDDPRQRTTYYSYPNLPSEGSLTIKDESGQKREMEVVGKSWYDRQWGPFRLLDRDSHWEWFSLRFFDDEEVRKIYMTGVF